MRVLPFRLLLGLALSLALSVLARAADNWIEVRSPHFTVSTNAGEKEARKIADQFEQIRQMFHSSFATLRVDPPQPIVIIAAKNENTMKVYLPEEWETKGHIHHAGLYQAGEEKDYVLLRLDTEGANPYHTLYHEYTHALLRLNFNRLPLWLDEGFAEFFGNSTIYEKEIRTGTIDESHLYILGQNKLIPIDTLLQVDHGSPYYNESDRASVFYAESWALVHFLMMDPDARQAQFLKNFLDAFNKSNDQVAAAKETFGDLKQFGQRIDAYARQRSFMVSVIKTTQTSNEKNYPSRVLSPGEVLAERGDFYVHHNRAEQAKPVLEDALKQEPNLAAAHEAMGFYYYRMQQSTQADEQMQEAIRLGAKDFVPYFIRGLALVERHGYGEEPDDEGRKCLEKATQLNPEFAPAYEALARTYPHDAAGQKLAIEAAFKAAKLDPGVIQYSVNLAYALLNGGRTSDARIMSQRINKAAETPTEKLIAKSLEQSIQQREEWDARRKSNSQGYTVSVDASPHDTSVSTGATFTRQPAPQQVVLDEYEGPLGDVDCSKKPEIIIHALVDTGPVQFHAADSSKVELGSASGVAAPSLASCKQWKGRQARVWFSRTPGKEYVGEVTKVQFF